MSFSLYPEVPTGYHHQDTLFNNTIVQRFRDEIGNYRPPWWYSAILGAVVPFGGHPTLKCEQQRLLVEDGEEVLVDWYPRRPTPENTKDEPLVKVIVYFSGTGLPMDQVRCFLTGWLIFLHSLPIENLTTTSYANTSTRRLLLRYFRYERS